MTKLAVALRQGMITQATIDDNVQRILRAIIRVGLLDGAAPSRPRHGQLSGPPAADL